MVDRHPSRTATNSTAERWSCCIAKGYQEVLKELVELEAIPSMTFDDDLVEKMIAIQTRRIRIDVHFHRAEGNVGLMCVDQLIKSLFRWSRRSIKAELGQVFALLFTIQHGIPPCS